jgi:hypothetical protein
MRTLKLVGVVLVALVLAALGGWMWGARGTTVAETALVESGVRQHVAMVRISLLQARMDLFQLNFGNATHALDTARADLVTLEGALAQRQDVSGVEATRTAMGLVAEAQRQVSLLDQRAQATIERAIAAVPGVWAPAPSPR